MSGASMSTRRARRRRASAGLIAALSVGLVVMVAVAGVFVFALFRPEAVAVPSPPPPVSAATPSPTETASAEPMPASPSTPSPVATSTPASPPPASPATQPCDAAVTTMTVWAHPDDDIIFANPTISEAISAGECVRTVFFTAGDAGRGSAYVDARELGILRAYDSMRATAGFWDATELTLDSGARVRRLAPQGDARVSVLFLRLPDGNISGAGFGSTGGVTLGALYDGGVDRLTPVDGGPTLTRDQLVATVRELVGAFSPTRTLTHVPRGSAFAAGDHPDHSAVGTLVRDVIGSDPDAGPGIRYFVGYPSAGLPRNVDGQVLAAKVDTYRLYAQQDDVVRCADRSSCLNAPRFGDWLQRSYPKTEAELQME